jgi:EAL domain-containing protein (putative c-di-GMP-specific phosphodiesterase class I)
MRTRSTVYLAVAAFLTYAIAGWLLAAPLDQVYWNVRYFLRDSAAPANIVVVRLDRDEDQPDRNADNYAGILRTLRASQPAHVFLDAGLRRGSPALVAELEAWGAKASLVARQTQLGVSHDDGSFDLPRAELGGSTEIVVSAPIQNFWKYVVMVPCTVQLEGRSYRSLASAASNADCASGNIRPDFSVDPTTIRIEDASRLTRGAASTQDLRGKIVIISSFADKKNGTLGYFAHRQQPLIALDIAAIAGAHDHTIMPLRFEFLMALFTIFVTLAQRIRNTGNRWCVYGLAALIAFAGPLVFEYFGHLIYTGSTLVVMMVFAAWRAWSRWRKRVIETGNTGLPNFVKLGGQAIPAGFNVVVAVIGRYEEFLATLPTDLHGECARQIARRFSVGCGTAEIYHGEGGHFAWIEQDRDADNQIEHYEGMRALFSAPLLVGGHMFDTNVHFGIDRNGQFDTLTRLNTALASASEALRSGRTIEQFEANRLANAPWELSLLARIDEGMRNGDIWLAYQPQWDYGDNRISGSEALIRWNDPVRGPIRPDEFILQAERAGRIDALTYWVLEQAITAAEAFNAIGPHFQMSINLSAQLVDKASLVSATTEIVRRRGIDCRLLTMEVTETASVYNRPAAIRNLTELQAMGFRVSIDDFGTGEASLCYLADLPSDELKLDRRFVARIVESDRDRKIVQSTISLAHALGQVVVAEGIEDLATFDMLRRMGCDIAQGYYIGKPETFDQLRARYLAIGPQGGKSFTAC